MTTNLTIETFPNEAAANYIHGKAIASPENFGALPDQLKQRAFTVASIEQTDVLRKIRDAIAKVPEGSSWDEAKKEIAAHISPFVGTGDAKADMAAAKARASFLLRTHGFQAYAVARHQQQMETVSVFPYWKYETVGDDRVRSSHKALDGKIVKANDPWWKTHYPPWDWGCRCIVIEMTERDAMREGVTQHNNIPTPDRSGTFLFDPTNLTIDLDSLREGYDEADWTLRFVAPAKNVSMQTEDGRNMSMWQYSLEQQAIKLAKTLSGGTDAFKARFEMAAVLSGKTGKRIDFAVGNKSRVDVHVPPNEDAIIIHTHPSGSSNPSYDDIRTFLEISNGQKMFHYIAGVPNPSLHKQIHIRRIVVTGNPIDTKVIKEMQELDKLIKSDDELVRAVAKLQINSILKRLHDDGCIDSEVLP